MAHWTDELPPKSRRTFIAPKRVFRLIGLCCIERLTDVFDAGADPNCLNKKGRPALHHAVRGLTIEHPVVTLLLARGADPNGLGSFGLTALDHANRRLLKWAGKPYKKPRRSPSLTAGGELNLPNWEWAEIEKMREEHPDFVDFYIEGRRKVAERVFDTRGNLEGIVDILEPLTKK